MSLRFPSVCISLVLGSALVAQAAALRICADPDNLPFCNRVAHGFDNRIAALVAHDLNREPVFVRARNGRGFLREQFNKDACNFLMGLPKKMKGVPTTVPCYRSAHVFVTRGQQTFKIASFTDP